MDSAFATAAYSGYTTDELRQMVSRPSANARAMWAEIDRRERVANGDVSAMTAGERLRHVRSQQA
jgi:sporulation-control protein spo0M